MVVKILTIVVARSFLYRQHYLRQGGFRAAAGRDEDHNPITQD
jgi:hypothetical protein